MEIGPDVLKKHLKKLNAVHSEIDQFLEIRQDVWIQR